MPLSTTYLSRIYYGLFNNSRTFASFKEKDELDLIWNDIQKYLTPNDVILDPMSGYGGCMRYFGKKGFKTLNIEINPPSYYWQYLINPIHFEQIHNAIQIWSKKFRYLKIASEAIVVCDKLFSDESVNVVKQLYQWMIKYVNNQDVVISMLLPFVSRFATYQHDDHNLTSVTAGGIALLTGWERDFKDYLQLVEAFLNVEYARQNEHNHQQVLSDWMLVNLKESYKFFVTSPPYPNYRDYAKIFSVENYVLGTILQKDYDYKNMIGSNVVKNKSFGEIRSVVANRFFEKLYEKSLKLKAKSRNDIKVYYLPYFKLYFYNLQEAYRKLANSLTQDAIGYIVANDNITRDIPIPVGEFIREVFQNLGFNAEDIETSQVHHMGNINHNAKRINALHVHHIIKVWR